MKKNINCFLLYSLIGFAWVSHAANSSDEESVIAHGTERPHKRRFQSLEQVSSAASSHSSERKIRAGFAEVLTQPIGPKQLLSITPGDFEALNNQLSRSQNASQVLIQASDSIPLEVNHELVDQFLAKLNATKDVFTYPTPMLAHEADYLALHAEPAAESDEERRDRDAETRVRREFWVSDYFGMRPEQVSFVSNKLRAILTNPEDFKHITNSQLIVTAIYALLRPQADPDASTIGWLVKTAYSIAHRNLGYKLSTGPIEFWLDMNERGELHLPSKYFPDCDLTRFEILDRIMKIAIKKLNLVEEQNRVLLEKQADIKRVRRDPVPNKENPNAGRKAGFETAKARKSFRTSQIHRKNLCIEFDQEG